MITALWQLVGVLTTTFVVPFTTAQSPLSLPLPQNFNATAYVRSHLTTAFATDPYAAVAAAVDEQPQLQTFITNNQSCIRQGEDLSYRVVVRNMGLGAARDITVQFQYPQTVSFRDSDPKPSQQELPDTRLIEWHADELPPGATTAYSIILNVQQPIANSTVNVTVFYVDQQGQALQTLSSHTIDGPCGTSPAPAATASPNKQPAIVCDPADITCSPTYQDLTLGLTYTDVARENRSVNCTGDGCSKKPDLGARFTEAIADIVPGECRVVEDDVITKPEFHDALNRRAKPAAFYLRPLYDSGQDYRAMTIENRLEAIPHFSRVRQKLREAHNRNWDDLERLIDDILKGNLNAPAAVSRYDSLVPQWEQRIDNLNEGFLQDYRSVQDKKKRKFDPVANQAAINSGTSQCRACGPPCGPDEGLRQKLLSVKEAYEQSLDERTGAYPQTQVDSKTAYSQYLARVREAFRIVLEQYASAKAAADQSPNSKDRQRAADNAATVLRAFPTTPATGTATAALVTTYNRHDEQDEARDNDIRLQQWETALDGPKTAATACEKENIFPPKVATTWCESGSSPELIIQEAPEPAKATAGGIRPPAPIAGGEQAIINSSAVKGTVCGEEPGDPYWTLNCKCKCDDLVPCGGTLYLCQDLYTCTFDPLDRIERHDIHVTSQEECFWDGNKHEDPFF